MTNTYYKENRYTKYYRMNTVDKTIKSYCDKRVIKIDSVQSIVYNKNVCILDTSALMNNHNLIIDLCEKGNYVFITSDVVEELLNLCNRTESYIKAYNALLALLKISDCKKFFIIDTLRYKINNVCFADRSIDITISVMMGCSKLIKLYTSDRELASSIANKINTYNKNLTKIVIR